MKTLIWINPHNSIAFVVDDGIIIKSTRPEAVGKPESHVMGYSSVMRYQLPHQIGKTTSADGWGRLIHVEVVDKGNYFDTVVIS